MRRVYYGSPNGVCGVSFFEPFPLFSLSFILDFFCLFISETFGRILFLFFTLAGIGVGWVGWGGVNVL